MSNFSTDNSFKGVDIAFEHEWTTYFSKGLEPNISNFYDHENHSLDLLLQLCCIDLQKRILLNSKNPKNFEDYLLNFPKLKTIEKSKIELVRCEIEAKVLLGIDIDFSKISEKYSIDVQYILDLKPVSKIAENNNQFDLIKKLGQGAYGVVYLAKDFIFSKPIDVALKVLVNGSSETLERFKEEASKIAQLRHPNVIQIYRYGLFKNHNFYTMEYCKETLADLVKNKPMHFKKAAEIISQVAKGIGTAHNQNIIHRDIKPENILISFDGTPKVADFGLAKDLNSDQNLTLTGNLIGTRGFIAPEQLLGEKIHRQSDVYSLGATLYKIISGKYPFPMEPNENLKELIDKVTKTEPKLLRKIVPDVPRDLNNIIHKALNRNIFSRYKNGNELAADLDRFLEGKPVTARNINFLEKFSRWTKANPLLFTFFSSIFIFLIFLGVQNRKINFTANKLMDALEETRLNQKKAEINKKLAEEKSEEAERFINVANAEKKEALKQSEIAGNLSEFIKYPKIIMNLERNEFKKALDQLESIPFSKRDWEHDFLFSIIQKNKRELLKHDQRIENVRLFANDRKIFINDDTKIILYELVLGRIIKKIMVQTSEKISLVLSSNLLDTILIVTSNSKLAKIKDNQLQFFETSIKENITTGCINPLKNQAYLALQNGKILVLDLIKGSVIKEFIGHENKIEFLEFIPYSGKLISCEKNGKIKIWNSETYLNDVPEKTIETKTHILSFSTNPNSKYLVILDDSSNLKAIELSSGKEIWNTKTKSKDISKVIVSKDGRSIIAAKKGEFIIYDMFDGSQINSFPNDLGFVSYDLTMNGNFIVCGESDLFLWDLQPTFEFSSFLLPIKNQLKVMSFDNNNNVIFMLSEDQKKSSLSFLSLDIPFNDYTILWESHPNHIHNKTIIFLNNALNWCLNYSLRKNTKSKLLEIPNSNRYLEIDTETTVSIKEKGTAREIVSLNLDTKAISSIHISPNGQSFLVIFDDGWMKLYQTNHQMPYFAGMDLEGDEREKLFKPRYQSGKVFESTGNVNSAGKVFLIDNSLKQTKTKKHLNFEQCNNLKLYNDFRMLKLAERENDVFGINFYKNKLKK